MRAGWTALGGVWTGKWMKGKTPDGAQVLYTLTSKPLSLMIRDMNKNSINPIARNLFLGISAGTPGGATRLASRNAVTQWMASQGIPTEGFLIDNGSGLSRTARISTDQLTGVLLAAGKKPWSPEFMSSLPIAGVDGTMKRRGLEEGGAHIKTGYIRGVRSVAGYVRSASGTLYAVSAIVNDPNALGAKPVLDAVLNYAASDGAAEASSPLPSVR
jgi:D-alanyl-D-alanine carboxypeptidase/D-alanyl-D-alanine-endopeptidase (penicillin-binding protein 4)